MYKCQNNDKARKFKRKVGIGYQSNSPIWSYNGMSFLKFACTFGCWYILWRYFIARSSLLSIASRSASSVLSLIINGWIVHDTMKPALQNKRKQSHQIHRKTSNESINFVYTIKISCQKLFVEFVLRWNCFAIIQMFQSQHQMPVIPID